MRTIAHDALVGAREVLGDLVRMVGRDNRLSDDELAARYMALHRGRPAAIAQFAAQNAPKGANPVEQAHRYEKQMEALLKARGLDATQARPKPQNGQSQYR